jgi:hypothetical protein
LTLLQAAKECEIMQTNKAKKHSKVISSSRDTVSVKDLAQVKSFTSSGLSIGPVTRILNEDVKYQQRTISSDDKNLRPHRSSKATDSSNIPQSAIGNQSLTGHVKGGRLSQLDKGPIKDSLEGVCSAQLPIETESATVPNTDERLQLSQVEACDFVTMPLIHHDAACPTTTPSEISNSEVTNLFSPAVKGLKSI